eukprot:2410070-Alexandrium_andersonii.AAC.1
MAQGNNPAAAGAVWSRSTRRRCWASAHGGGRQGGLSLHRGRELRDDGRPRRRDTKKRAAGFASIV